MSIICDLEQPQVRVSLLHLKTERADTSVARCQGRSRWPVLLLLAGYLLFCHGCHGDEDNELFGMFRWSLPSAAQMSPLDPR